MNKTYNFDFFANVPKRDLVEKTFYNPNSVHFLGTDAFIELTNANTKMKSFFPQYDLLEFIPGGGSLANNRAILDQMKIKNHIIHSDRNVVLMSSIEHSSISRYITQSLNERGYIIIIVPVTSFGIINILEFQKLINEYGNKIALVTCMMVNNEIGVIQPLETMLEITKSKSKEIIFHSDVSCCISIFMDKLKNSKFIPDTITFSSYKFGGPHFGVLLSNTQLRQQYTGTPDVQSIVNVTRCLEQYLLEQNFSKIQDAEFKKVLKETIYNYFDEEQIEYRDLDTSETIHNLLSFVLPDLKASIIQQKLSNLGIAIGSGSACLSNEGSHTLKAMGYDNDISQKLVRLSFNVNNLDISEKEYKEVSKSLASKIVDVIKENKFLTKKTENKIIEIVPTHKIILPSVREEQIFTGVLDTPLINVLIDTIGLTYGEMSLKGNNQVSFIDKAKNEIVSKLRMCQIGFNIIKLKGMIQVKLDQSLQINSDKLNDLLSKLLLVSGIAYIIPMTKIISKTPEEVCYEIASIYNKERENVEEKTFKIRATISSLTYLNKRAKDWEYFVGRYIKDRFNDIVNLNEAKITVNMLFDGQNMFCYTKKIQGLSGLPTGSEGTVMFYVTKCNYMRSLISIFNMVKRGVSPIILLDDKCKELYDSLNSFSVMMTKKSKLYLIDVSDKYFLDKFKSYKSRHLIIEISTLCSDMISFDLTYLKLIGQTTGLNVFCTTYLMTFEEVKNEINNLLSVWNLSLIQTNDSSIENSNIFTPFKINLSKTESIKTNSRGLVLISGGIDSPVVSSKLLEKNIDHSYVHFISRIDDEISKTKIIEIIKKINTETNNKEIYFVNFGKLQKLIAEKYKEDYRVMLYKIYMVIISNDIAKENNYNFISMGNSWGQVASQTPDNLFVTDLFSDLPIFNPLISYNKEEIKKDAIKFKTYELSICNSNDCCVLYLPKNPILKASEKYIKSVIDEINYKDIVDIIKI